MHWKYRPSLAKFRDRLFGERLAVILLGFAVLCPTYSLLLFQNLLIADGEREPEMTSNRPTNPKEILLNMKQLLDGSFDAAAALLKNDEIKKTFGAESMNWDMRKEGVWCGTLSQFGKILPDYSVSNKIILEGVSANVRLETQAGHFLIKLYVRMRGSSGVSIDAVKDIFGGEWEVDKSAIIARMQQHKRKFAPKTHPLGNMPFVSSQKATVGSVKILVELNAAGNLNVIEIIVKDEQ